MINWFKKKKETNIDKLSLKSLMISRLKKGYKDLNMPYITTEYIEKIYRLKQVIDMKTTMNERKS